VLALAVSSASAQYPNGARTGQPQRPVAAPPAAPALPPVSGGKVMYFYKPADALVPSGLEATPGGDALAQAPTPTPPAGGSLPDFVPSQPLPIPAPSVGTLSVTERPIPIAPAAPVVQQPYMISTSQRQDEKPRDATKEIDTRKYTQLPPRDKIFTMYNDVELERMVVNGIREELLKKGKAIGPDDEMRFPVSPPVGGGIAYVPKTQAYPPMQTVYDSLYVIHRRLHFEDKNTERQGWDFGIVQPLVSAMLFYKDVLVWPSKLASGVAYGRYDTSAGKCMPGSPTPYLLYPPELTISGGLVEAAIVTGTVFIFP
jgi:hypothetical protein